MTYEKELDWLVKQVMILVDFHINIKTISSIKQYLKISKERNKWKTMIIGKMTNYEWGESKYE